MTTERPVKQIRVKNEVKYITSCFMCPCARTYTTPSCGEWTRCGMGATMPDNTPLHRINEFPKDCPLEDFGMQTTCEILIANARKVRSAGDSKVYNPPI